MCFAEELPVNVVTPAPCQGAESAPWSGPIVEKICTDEFGEWGASDGKGVCCYWIVYHERTINTNPTERYETNITEIFFEGEDCEERSRGDIIHRFQEFLYKSKPYDFFAYHAGTYDPYVPATDWSGSATMTFYTTGGCYQKDSEGNTIYNEEGEPLPCNPDDYCCKYEKQVFLNHGEVTGIDSIIGLNNEPLFVSRKDTMPFTFNCPSSCNKACDNVSMEHLVNLTCNLPCNETAWGPEEETDIDIPGCAGCKITVIFRKRTTPPCPEFGMESVNDIQLFGLKYNYESGQPCYTCSVSDQTLHTIAMQYLLNNIFTDLPAPDNCKTNYRIIQSSCWHEHFLREDHPWLPRQRMLYACYPNNNCCMKRYKICRDINGNLLPPELLYTSSTEEDCHFAPYPCLFICDPEE